MELEEPQRPPLCLDFYCGQQFKSGNPNITAAGNPKLTQLRPATYTPTLKSALHKKKAPSVIKLTSEAVKVKSKFYSADPN